MAWRGAIGFNGFANGRIPVQKILSGIDPTWRRQSIEFETLCCGGGDVARGVLTLMLILIN
ncbi:hypothetical protein QUB68_01430 [Microcoleus sp. A006_D1]|uniref:hypothetical protein n=1 Tax=Microcoleus sp. A006_D1 TaxID=3055267 RepID=UPI002FD704CE